MPATLRKPLTALVALAIVSLSFVVGYAYKKTSEATEVLNDVRAVIAAPDSTAKFKLLKVKYGARLVQSESCSEEWCSYEINTANDFLAVLRLIPYTELTTRFDLKESVLTFAMIEYRTALTNAASPVVHVQVDFCAEGCAWVFVNPWERMSEQHSNGIVEMGSSATTQDRDNGLNLNLRCLSKIGGCRDIADVLPAIWERTPSGRMACRVCPPEGKGMISH